MGNGNIKYLHTLVMGNEYTKYLQLSLDLWDMSVSIFFLVGYRLEPLICRGLKDILYVSLKLCSRITEN